MFTRHKTHNVYRQTKTKILNLAVIAAMLLSSLSTTAPFLFGDTATALGGGSEGHQPSVTIGQNGSTLADGASTTSDADIVLAWTVGANSNSFGNFRVDVDAPGTSHDRSVSVSQSTTPWNWTDADFGAATPTSYGAYKYTVNVLEKNNVDVKAWTSVTVNFAAPLVTPTVALNFPANNTVLNDGNITFSWTGNPGTYPISQYEVSGEKVGVGGFGTTVGDQSYTPSGLLGDGDYTWQVRAKDTNGNWGSWSDTWAFAIDSTAPEVPEHMSPLNNSFQNFNDFYFDWTDVADAVEYEFQASTSPSVDGDGALNTSVWNNKLHGAPDRDFLSESTIHSYGANGTWYWQVRAIDSAGNKTDWTTPWKITIDMAAPSAPVITNPLAEQYFATTPILNKWGVASDSSGIAKYQIAYNYDDGHTFGSSTCPGLTMSGYSGFIGCRDLNGTQRNHTPGTGEQGGVTIWVRALDNAGNWSDWSTPVHYYYDAMPPSVPVALFSQDSNGANVPDGGYTNSQNFTFNLSSSSDTTRYQLRYWNDIVGSPFKEASPWNPTDLSGYSPVLGTYKDNFTQGEGVHYFAFSACDAAGNCSAYGAPFVVIFDKTAPDVNITGFGQAANVIQPNVTATDPSTPLTYSWTTNAGVVISNTSALNPTFTVNTEGSYTFSLTVTDAAGNSTTVPFSFTYTTPPVTPPAVEAAFTNVGTTTNNNSTPTPVDITDEEDEDGPTDPLVLSTGIDSSSEVEGESTTVVENAASTKGNDFLGLGWWWLAILGTLGLFWLLFFARRRSEDEK